MTLFTIILCIAFVSALTIFKISSRKDDDDMSGDNKNDPDEEITTEERHFHSIDPELYN